MSEVYRNRRGKASVAFAPDITILESANRREYYEQVLAPGITTGFANRGEIVVVSLVGSVSYDQAGPESDIDCLVEPVVPIHAVTAQSWGFLQIAREVWFELLPNAIYRFDLFCVIGNHSIRV